mmetsp:Transcript_4893/g.6752  ORF Transcript_4893/g.6752 Transcript_4893/m.6752 type:complete len:115 (+) Transcript_4893:15-359(+)
MVLSSFLVGAFASTITSVLIYEKLRDRRFLFEKKFNEKDISEYVYKTVLEDRIRQKQNQRQSISEKETKKHYNELLISSINIASEFLFQKLPAMIPSNLTKKENSAENSTEKTP